MDKFDKFEKMAIKIDKIFNEIRLEVMDNKDSLIKVDEDGLEKMDVVKMYELVDKKVKKIFPIKKIQDLRDIISFVYMDSFFARVQQIEEETKQKEEKKKEQYWN